MKKYFIILVFLARTISAQTNFSMFPQKNLVPQFTANATAHRMSFEKNIKINNFFGSIGTIRPLVLAEFGSTKAEASIAGSMHTTLQKSPGHWQVIDVAFFVDVLFDVALTPTTQIRFGPGHTSHHLADDAFELLNYKKSINYVRDYYQLFAIQHINFLNGFVYSGAFYNYIFRIDSVRVDTWIFQVGAELFNTHISQNIFFYTGFDVKFHGELEYGTSQNYQIGIKYEQGDRRAIRFAYNYHTGLEERGQFFRDRTSTNTLGFYVDF